MIPLVHDVVADIDGQAVSPRLLPIRERYKSSRLSLPEPYCHYLDLPKF